MIFLIIPQAQQSVTIWETVFAIILAFLGSGIVTYLIERNRDSKKAKMMQHLIVSEVKMNLEVLESTYVQRMPWVAHKTWSAFYDANSIEVTSFSNKGTAEKILHFYASLEMLRLRDGENAELDRLVRQSTHNAIARFQKDLGESKADIRNTLIELGKQIQQAKS